LAVLVADLLHSLLRNCCSPERRQQNPCAHWWLRPLAAAEAFVMATCFSEAGRLVGHLKRRSWASLCSNFDWFCGSQPVVVAEEQRRAAVRAAAKASRLWQPGSSCMLTDMWQLVAQNCTGHGSHQSMHSRM
jgi:hypothetical protein